MVIELITGWLQQTKYKHRIGELDIQCEQFLTNYKATELKQTFMEMVK